MEERRAREYADKEGGMVRREERKKKWVMKSVDVITVFVLR